MVYPFGFLLSICVVEINRAVRLSAFVWRADWAEIRYCQECW